MKPTLEEKYNTLQRKYHHLEARYEEVVKENQRLSGELSRAEFRIHHELEPRIKQEKEAYDSFVVNGGSDQCMSYGMYGKCGLDCPVFGDRDGCAECLAEISDNDLLYFYLSRRDTFKSIAVVRENLIFRGLEEHVQAIDTAYKYHKAHGAK